MGGRNRRVGVSEGTRMSKISVHFQAGMDAYERGDYGTALKEFRPLAEQGHAQAQVNLGIIYSQARGVPKDSVQAYRWYTLAAGQSVPK